MNRSSTNTYSRGFKTDKDYTAELRRIRNENPGGDLGVRRGQPQSADGIGNQFGNALGGLSSVFGAGAAGAEMMGTAAVVGGVAMGPILGAAGVAAGLGYGTYKLGESFHLW